MNAPRLWILAKVLEGLGLLVVLWGLFLSVSLGMKEQGLASMGVEFRGLTVGGLLFLAGWLIERRSGLR